MKKNYISLAKKSADIQINELKKVKKIFSNSFVKAIDLILNCRGKVIFAGIGKSGLIARKISATFSSVGIPSFFCLSNGVWNNPPKIDKKIGYAAYFNDLIINPVDKGHEEFSKILYGIIFKDFEDLLAEHSTLTIIPSSDMGIIPFETLIDIYSFIG